MKPDLEESFVAYNYNKCVIARNEAISMLYRENKKDNLRD
jgi:hypothetical protein